MARSDFRLRFFAGRETAERGIPQTVNAVLRSFGYREGSVYNASHERMPQHEKKVRVIYDASDGRIFDTLGVVFSTVILLRTTRAERSSSGRLQLAGAHLTHEGEDYYVVGRYGELDIDPSDPSGRMQEYATGDFDAGDYHKLLQEINTRFRRAGHENKTLAFTPGTKGKGALRGSFEKLYPVITLQDECRFFICGNSHMLATTVRRKQLGATKTNMFVELGVRKGPEEELAAAAQRLIQEGLEEIDEDIYTHGKDIGPRVALMNFDWASWRKLHRA